MQGELAEYSRRLRARFGSRVRLVRLFGSWARGEARPDSDVDVAVVIDGLTVEEWREALGLSAELVLEREDAEPLAPLVLSGDRWVELVRDERRLARDIEEQGIPV